MAQDFESASRNGGPDGDSSPSGEQARSYLPWHDPPLRVPPDPPLLTGNALQPVLRDVGLLLDYLNRLPEMKLENCFKSTQLHIGSTQINPLTPPCLSQSYFLGRIAEIAALGPRATTTDVTEPKTFKDENGKLIDSVAGEAKNLGNLAFLIWSRDFLAALASPATLDTIRVTRAFRAGRMMKSRRARISADLHDTADERDLFMSRYGLKIANRVSWFQGIAILLLWLSVYISVMVYSGQILMSENAKLQEDIAAFESKLRQTIYEDQRHIRELSGTSKDEASLLLVEDCVTDSKIPNSSQYIALGNVRDISVGIPNHSSPDLAQSASEFSGAHVFMSNRQRELCSEGDKLNRRNDELQANEAGWVEAAGPIIAISIPLPGIKYFISVLKREVNNENKDTAKKRTLETQHYMMQQLLNGLLAGVMPAMYAALGALVSLFRRIAVMAEQERLGPAEYGGMMSSLVLGALTGAVIGIFASVVPQSGQSAGLPLTTTALALLAGYAADRVFGMFDELAQRVFVAQAGASAKKS